jgi:hypothetical protein
VDGKWNEPVAGKSDEAHVVKAIMIPQSDWDLLGPRARDRISRILPEAVRHHAKAATHYPDGNADVLGLAGQFGDIWRKIGPLKRAMWDKEKLTREQPPEILMDLIGHCLLALQMYDERAEDEDDV